MDSRVKLLQLDHDCESGAPPVKIVLSFVVATQPRNAITGARPGERRCEFVRLRHALMSIELRFAGVGRLGGANS